MNAIPQAALAAALRELADRGFVAAGFRGGARFFRGQLPSPRGKLRVMLSISDWDFLEYPSIWVVDGLDKFPQLRPHLDELGGLCYFSRRSVVLDRYDPAMAVAQCLEQAEAVLAKILSDCQYVVQDIQNEFLVHWERQGPPPLTIHMGSLRPDAPSARLHFDQQERGAVLTDDPQAAQLLANAIGWSTLTEAINRCWLFRTETLPPIPSQFPQTVRELFEWLRDWDRRLYNAIQRRLGIDETYEFVLLALAVHTPLGWIGFMFKSQPPGRMSATQLKAYLHGRGGTTRITRLAMTDISPEFVHSRNLTFPDLTNKRVTLLGCGAIGSHLAAALVRLGAGQGPQGLLRLIDEESLLAENLGRHYLGYNRLRQDKAKALREELLRQFPLARIEAVPQSAQRVAALVQRDLLIEATGDEAVSEYLNSQWLERGRPVPVLYVWIKGNGECVQSLWTDKAEFACFRCLRLNDARAHRQERYPVLKRAPERKVLGCHAFTPYAVAAPLQAAALAIDGICDWLQGRTAPRFRTRARENVDLYPVESSDPAVLPDCPACASR